MANGFKRDFQLAEERNALLARRRCEQIEAERIRMDTKANLRLLDRRMHMERIEAEMEEKLTKAKEAEAMRAAQLEQEEKLAFEMKRLHHRQEVEMKLRQKLRKSSQELRALEGQLRAAYVTKELAAQLAEKEVHKMEEKIQERRVYEMLEAERKRAEEKQLQDLNSAKAKKLEYKQDLQEQIVEAYQKQQDAYQEFLREKALLDDIVRVIHEEDVREEEMRMMKMKKTKLELEEFRKMQDIWRQKEKEAIDEEDRRLIEFLERRQEEEKIKVEEAQRKEDIKNKVHEIIAQAMVEQDRKRIEREQVRQELIELERREAEESKRRQEIEKVLRGRLELRESQKQQLIERWQRLHEEEEQEASYKQKLMEKFAEDQRLDQLTAEKRRMKTLEYKAELQQLLEERHRERVEEMHELVALEEAQKQEDCNRRKLVEEERLRMLKEHASKLIGFLPRGVLREADLVQLGPDFINKLKAMNQ